MNFLNTIILSVIEGLTEFLPISSTGHLVLASHLLKISQTPFLKTFEIAIQLGAIVGVVFLYLKTLPDFKIWVKVISAFIPTSIIGFLFYSLIKDSFLEDTNLTIISLIIGGVVLILFEKLYNKQKSHISEIKNLPLSSALAIGLIQSISIIPGVSRAAATILGGLFFGLNRKTAVEFSFLLAIPTILGATTLDLVKTSFKFNSHQYLLLLTGFLVSLITALIVVKFFLKFIQKNTFIPFGIYRIVFALTIFFFLNF